MAKKKINKPGPLKSASPPPDSAHGGVAKKKQSTVDPYLIALGIVIFLVAIIRLRLLSMPFERDEGEYAYIGNLMLHGGMPYRDVYNMKLPGTYGMYSFIIALFGSSPNGIHLGLMMVSLITIVILFGALKKLFNPMIALVTVTIYGLLSLSKPYFGFAAHATHFIVLFVALGIFGYAKFTENRKWFYAALTGLLFGLAFLMKQQAVFFILFAAVMIVAAEFYNKPVQWKNLVVNGLLFSAGAVIPYIIVLLVMRSTGSFGKFWFWTVKYAQGYAVSNKDWSISSNLFSNSFGPMFSEYPLVWLAGLAGLVIVWVGKYSRLQKLFVTSVALCSWVAVCPGFFFRQHYFVVFLPALGLLSAITFDYLVNLIPSAQNNRIVKALPFVVILLMGFVAIARDSNYYIDDDVNLISKKCYGGNPFVEAPTIAKYIAANTSENDKIAVLGSEPELLVYAKRRSASGYVYMYPLMEIQPFNVKMQKELMAEIEAANAKYLVFYNISKSWLMNPGAPTEIFNWLNTYAHVNYEQVCLVNVPDGGGTAKFNWGNEATYPPPGRDCIIIAKRK